MEGARRSPHRILHPAALHLLAIPPALRRLLQPSSILRNGNYRAIGHTNAALNTFFIHRSPSKYQNRILGAENCALSAAHAIVIHLHCTPAAEIFSASFASTSFLIPSTNFMLPTTRCPPPLTPAPLISACSSFTISGMFIFTPLERSTAKSGPYPIVTTGWPLY